MFTNPFHLNTNDSLIEEEIEQKEKDDNDDDYDDEEEKLRKEENFQQYKISSQITMLHREKQQLYKQISHLQLLLNQQQDKQKKEQALKNHQKKQIQNFQMVNESIENYQPTILEEEQQLINVSLNEENKYVSFNIEQKQRIYFILRQKSKIKNKKYLKKNLSKVV